MYRCVICRELFDMAGIMNHMESHDDFWRPNMKLPGTLESFRQRFSPLGLDLIEEVEDNDVSTFEMKDPR